MYTPEKGKPSERMERKAAGLSPGEWEGQQGCQAEAVPTEPTIL